MLIANLLDDVGDQNAVRLALIQIRATLIVAAHDYAKDCLTAAQNAYEAAQGEASCAEVWTYVLESQEAAEKTHSALNMCMASTGLVVMSEETGDPDIDEVNSELKMDNIEAHVISALLEGAQTRLNLTYIMIPDNPAPGARCRPENLQGADDDEQDTGPDDNNDE